VVQTTDVLHQTNVYVSLDGLEMTALQVYTLCNCTKVHRTPTPLHTSITALRNAVIFVCSSNAVIVILGIEESTLYGL